MKKRTSNPGKILASVTKKRIGGSKQKRRWIVNWILVISIAITAFILIPAIIRGIGSLFQPRTIGTVKVDRYRDLNAIHLRFAIRSGITPFKTEKGYREGIDEMVRKDKLVKVVGNRYYVVKKLSHSHPYLTPSAAELMDEIGKRFREKLGEKGKPGYLFQVSSLLRTGESQNRLSRSNQNASGNSTHLYGTSFDIAYKSLIRKSFPFIRVEIADGPAIGLLSEAIGELRDEGKCKVVTEYQEKCFHITVTR